jgi:zinc protease
VDRARLDRIKSYLRYDFALALDSAPSVAVIVAEFLNLTGDPAAINRLYEQYQAVTPEDVQRVTREVFKESSQTVIRLAHAEPAAAGQGEGATEGAGAEGGE